MGPNKVERFLYTLRETLPDATTRYCNGDCFKLFQLLKALYPEAQPYYDIVNGHVYTQIGRSYYDIHGKSMVDPKKLTPMSTERGILKSAHRWKYTPPDGIDLDGETT